MAIFDLYGLLIEGMFGSLLISILAVSAVIFVIGAIMRMSFITIISIITIYLLITLTFGYGGVIGVLMFLATGIFFMSGLLPWINSMFSK